MANKTQFENQLSVIKVRKKYAAPYLKQKYIYLEKKETKTEKEFKQAINERMRNWPDGIYFLKLSSGKVFTRFRVINKRVQHIFKISPATGSKYPLHTFCIKNN